MCVCSKAASRPKPTCTLLSLGSLASNPWAPLHSGVTWWQLNTGGGWADGDYLEVCGGAGSNVFGVGLVSPGSDTQYDLVHGLVGDNGWIML